MDAIVLQLGQLRARQGRFDEAIKYANDLHGAVAAKYGERHIKTLSALVLVYDNLLAADRRGTASRSSKRSVTCPLKHRRTSASACILVPEDFISPPVMKRPPVLARLGEWR